MKAVLGTIFRPVREPDPKLDRLTQALDRMEQSADELQEVLEDRSSADQELLATMGQMAGMMRL